MLYNLTLKQYTRVDNEWIQNRQILIYDMADLWVVYEYNNSYGLTKVENLLRFEDKQNKKMVRDGIITVIKADGIEDARKKQKRIIEQYEEENTLPFC